MVDTNKYERNSTTVTVAASDDVVVASVLLALLIVGTIFGNSLVCVAFHLYRDLRSVTNYFVVSLAVADLLVGFGSMPLWFTYVVVKWPPYSPNSSSEVYTLWMCLDIVTATASIMSLAVISVDRFYAITSPFQYGTKITKSRARLYIFLVWVYAIVVSSFRAMPFFGKWYSYFVATASFFVPLPVMVFCYARIFSVARIQAAKIRRLDSVRAHVCESLQGCDRNGSATESSLFTDGKPRTSSSSARTSLGGIRSYFTKQRPTLISQNSFKQQRRALSSDIKAAKTLAIVMGVFILCWAPYIITLLINVSCESCIPKHEMYVLGRAVKWLQYSNSALNPVIYTLLNRGFRDGFRRVLCRVCIARRIQKAWMNSVPYNVTRDHPSGPSPRYSKKMEVDVVLVCDKVTVV